jgi:squalene-hopene/tetraprenyl-beta-curcumene cyclase
MVDARLVAVGRRPMDRDNLTEAVAGARRWLLRQQSEHGWWRGELEADATLESYFILLRAFLGSLDDPKISGYARALKRKMLPAGGYGQYRGGPPDLSVSCLGYFAL